MQNERDPVRVGRMLEQAPVAVMVALGIPWVARVASRLEYECASGSLLCLGVSSDQVGVAFGLFILLGAVVGLGERGKAGLAAVAGGAVVGSWAVWTAHFESDQPLTIGLLAIAVMIPLVVGFGLAMFISPRRPRRDVDGR
jgi:hypothetical protein